MGEESGSIQPRGLNRLHYFFCIVGFFVGVVVFISILNAAGGNTFRWLVVLLASATFIGWMYPMIKRIQNIGYRGWWVVLTLIPLFNLLFLMCCMAAPPGFRYSHKLDRTSYYIVGGYLAFDVAVWFAATWMPAAS
jgi:hypothetical protein